VVSGEEAQPLEGYGRNQAGNFLNFLRIAQGSVRESWKRTFCWCPGWEYQMWRDRTLVEVAIPSARCCDR
jgi:hypothetical protein